MRELPQAAQHRRRQTSHQDSEGRIYNLTVPTGLLSFLFDWGAAADVALVPTLLAFFPLSAGNHLWSALMEGNRKLRSFGRPAPTAGLLLATLPSLLTTAQGLR